MTLFCRELGGPEGGPVMVVLHGLYGSSRNWSTVGARLADPYRVLGLDLRNHGQSPHHPVMSYEAMAQDVVDVLDERGLESVVLMGHSLGGKVAMRTACSFGQRISHLLLLDIAPKRHTPSRGLVEALLVADLAVDRRARVEDQLRETIPDRATRSFLMTNLERVEGGFTWRPNLEGIRDSLLAIAQSPLGIDDQFEGPTDVIAGGRSDFVTEDDRPVILRHFPRARLRVLAGSGHNVHIEGGEEFVELVRRRLAESGG